VTRSGSRAGLVGRRNECQALDDLLAGVKAGRSAALVLRGEPGIGKTELMRYLLGRVAGCRIVRAAGVQTEMELSYAGLHQLCVPLLTGLDRLPEPQRDALRTAFGLRDGPVPDRFLVGLATLSLLADAVENQPLVCLVDDAQWLDRVSAQTLEFVARRLLAEPILLVFAVREPSPGETLAGLPELLVTGLTERDSRTLLDSVVTGPLDERVRDRIVAETRGNPLALLELPRGLTAAELTGFGSPDAQPLSSQVEQEFLRRVESLPAEAQRLVFTAAAEPVGDGTLLRRAAERLGIDVDAVVSHPDLTELITLGTRVRFRHPLVRSAAYRAASPNDLREVHQALADATDAELDPDRRAWHMARATAGPDETVAAELERSAGRARARGGVAAAGALRQRAHARSRATRAAHGRCCSGEAPRRRVRAGGRSPRDGEDRTPRRAHTCTAFGMRAGAAPERFLVGLAVLSLLSDATEVSPALCVVDDAQWMDRASAQVLGFVARRLLAESVALVFAARQRAQDLHGLPDLEITGLGTTDAHALLNSAAPLGSTNTSASGSWPRPGATRLPCWSYLAS
jgi:hypothetical protein